MVPGHAIPQVTEPPAPEPLVQMVDDQARARGLGDLCAERCYLATITAAGDPALRTLVLRGIGEGRLEIFFNATSPKWRQLQSNPRYELLVYWPTIGRQYRLRGGFEPIPGDVMAASWQRRNKIGKQLDLYYSSSRPQSSVVDDVADFERRLADLRRALDDGTESEPPDSIMGLRLMPYRVEFLDVSAVDQVHRRYLYISDGKDWRCRPLVP